MEQISNQLQQVKVETVKAQISSLQVSKVTYQDSEQKMLQLKYVSKPIGTFLNHTWCKALLLKIHVITGWKIPDDEMLDILIDQFSKKMLEDYPQLNVDEIEFAFRSKGTKIKDWGKAMNLSLIEEVLSDYASDRYELSQREERQKHKPVQMTYTPEELLNIQRADVEAFYQRCLNGVIPPNELPGYFKDILVHDK